MSGITNRRTFLKYTGGASVVGLAGCLGDLGVGGGGGPIPMGSMLPVTGPGESFGGGEQSAVNLAVEHVNDAGGPLGREIEMTNKDTESRPEAAAPKYRELVDENGVIGFVGAAFSGVSAVLAQNVADDEVMQISPASTSPIFADIGWKTIDGQELKFFGRTAPNDVQQGIVMGQVLSSSDFIGAEKAAFLFRQDPYGQGLADAAGRNFEEAGGTITGKFGFSIDQTDFTSTLDQISQADPDAVGLIATDALARPVLNQWREGGYDWEWVASEGLDTPAFFEEFDPTLIEGIYITSANPAESPQFTTYKDLGGSVDLFAPHAYDGLMIQAIAIHKSGEATGAGIARSLLDVTNPPGDVVGVNEFQKAKDIIDDGGEVNYQGASSPVDLNENYEPFVPFAIKRVVPSGDQSEAEILRELPREWFADKL